MEQEIWKDIKGYEGKYQVSNQGKVKSLRKVVISKIGNNFYSIVYDEKILKPIEVKGKDSKSYTRVHIGKGKGKRELKSIHRLVAQAFIPNPNNYPQINHINGDKQDNRVQNLEWCTAKYNTQHAIKSGLKKVYGHPEGHPVIAINIETQEKNYFDSVYAVSKFLGQSCDHGLKRRKEKYKNKPYIVKGYSLKLAKEYND